MTELTKAQKIKYLNRLEWFLNERFDCGYCPLDNFNYKSKTHEKHFSFSSNGDRIYAGFCKYCRDIVKAARCPCMFFANPTVAKLRGLAAIKQERKKLGLLW